MNDFSFMKKMSEEDAYLFKKCIIILSPTCEFAAK